jgi:uncharacterized protein YaiI (UPF0178 family)
MAGQWRLSSFGARSKKRGKRWAMRYRAGASAFRLPVVIQRNEGNVHIWVDADACPKVIKEILFRAAERTGVAMTLVANQPLAVPRLKNIRTVRVGAGFDVADNEIVRRLDAGDLVVTADIPLAAEVIAKGGHALNPRGELYTTDNIKARLSMRDFMDSLRATGVETGGPASFNQADRQAFANQLDRFLSLHFRRA